MAASFNTLTSGCRFGTKQREQQRKHFQGKAMAESSRESALGSMDFFGGNDEATTSTPTEDAESAVPTSRAARRRRAARTVLTPAGRAAGTTLTPLR